MSKQITRSKTGKNRNRYLRKRVNKEMVAMQRKSGNWLCGKHCPPPKVMRFLREKYGGCVAAPKEKTERKEEGGE